VRRQTERETKTDIQERGRECAWRREREREGGREGEREREGAWRSEGVQKKY
jgi:hypothetical protein